jgi:hypothetical protein
MIKIFKDELFSQIKEVKPKKIVPNKYYYYVPNEIKKKPQKKSGSSYGNKQKIIFFPDYSKFLLMINLEL